MEFSWALLLKGVTAFALAGLLFEIGLRLTWRDLGLALRAGRWGVLLPLHFGWIPLIAWGVVSLLAVPQEGRAGFILLAAAPFAPVVPIFARIARADVALAAALSAVFPLFCVVGTPLVCALAAGVGAGFAPSFGTMLPAFLLLSLTVPVPLLAGIVLLRAHPALAERCRPLVQHVAEVAGAFSLGLVVALEWRSLITVDLRTLLAIVLIYEISAWFGARLGGGDRAARRVHALGAGNRNIALAVLLAVDWGESGVLAEVARQGVLMILLGLGHAGYWAWSSGRESERTVSGSAR